MNLIRVFHVTSANGRKHLSTLSQDEAVRHAQGIFRATRERVTPDVFEELHHPTDHTAR